MSIYKKIICLFFISAFFVTNSPADGEETVKNKTFRDKCGIQTYSLRSQIARDGAKALDFLKEQGFHEVEICLDNHYGMSQEDMQKALTERGLVPVAALADFNFLLNQTENAVKIAKTFGVKYAGTAAAPHTSPWDESQVLKTAEQFNEVGKAFKDAGIQFVYHNHGFEFLPYKDGETLFDLLAQKTDPELVKFEMDILWTVCPGQDPIALLKKYPSRWVLIHLKDAQKETAPDGSLTKCDDVILGTGNIHFTEIMKTAQEIGVKHFFIEDESENVLERVPQSLKNLSTITLPKKR
ncbi:MAG: sugar phosphate isomerase/epimerase family protein [Thermoguttaceae bacterium]